jgi:hypothetical protein
MNPFSNCLQIGKNRDTGLHGFDKELSLSLSISLLFSNFFAQNWRSRQQTDE